MSPWSVSAFFRPNSGLSRVHSYVVVFRHCRHWSRYASGAFLQKSSVGTGTSSNVISGILGGAFAKNKHKDWCFVRFRELLGSVWAEMVVETAFFGIFGIFGVIAHGLSYSFVFFFWIWWYWVLQRITWCSIGTSHAFLIRIVWRFFYIVAKIFVNFRRVVVEGPRHG